MAIGLRARGPQVHARRRSSRSASSRRWSLVGAAAWFFARPLSRKVTDEQVALYLEEHEPSLDAAILSAMEATERPSDASPRSDPAAGGKRDRARPATFDEGQRIERDPMRRYAWGRRRRRRGGDRALHVRPRVFAAHAVGAVRHLARRGSRRAVPHRRQAGERHRAQGRGSDHQRRAVRDSTPPRRPS